MARRRPPGPPGPPVSSRTCRPAAPTEEWTCPGSARSTGNELRRSLYLTAVVILLPMVTFTMAYLIVDVPKPGSIRTSKVPPRSLPATIKSPKLFPRGNRVDVNLSQVPMHVRQAVIAARPVSIRIRVLVHRLRAGGQEQPVRRRSAGRIATIANGTSERFGRFRTARGAV